MRAALVAGLAIVAGVTLAGQSAPQPARPPDTSVKAVVAAASRYVEEYAKQMQVIVGDETYIQEQYASSTLPPEKTRLMRGEMFLTFLPADHTWISVHDITEVDGEKIDRQVLQQLLAKSAVQSVAEQVANHNGRFNLGSRPRNLNEPTLALLVLDQRRLASMEFKRELVETVNGVTLVTLSFVERHPSLVKNENGRPWTAKGSMLVEAATGRVRQTRISFSEKPTFTELTTIYTPEPRLNLWLPSLFTELYESEPYGLKEIVKTRATYTNYRRYESFGRIRGGGGSQK